MALVAGAVANGGRVMRPYVMEEIVSPSGETLQKASPEEWLTAMEPATAATLTTMMQRVVSSGTGTAAALEGIAVAGKSGTAERGDGTNLAWFIAFAPAERPHGRRSGRGRGQPVDRRGDGCAARRRRAQGGSGAGGSAREAQTAREGIGRVDGLPGERERR